LRGMMSIVFNWRLLFHGFAHFFLKYFLVKLGVYHICVFLGSGVHGFKFKY
jgi:hypothetical protein